MSAFEPKPFGRYILIDKIAVGGMAEIYKAKTFGVDGFEKQLAIKRILPHCSADKDFIKMLIDEAKLTVLLSHANIVQVYDLGKVNDDYFISMEFIHGTNLREIMSRSIDRGEKIHEEIAIYIMSEACKGLDYAHRKTDNEGNQLKIVHRDISPQNILISYEGEVKIVDFGIAKAAHNISHTMAGILKGKIAYMSPEQALGKPIDSRTDIFSAGIILYEMLSGSKLFKGDTQFEILKKIRSTRVDAMSLPENLPTPLKNILAKALAYNPNDRYQTAGEFQLDLTKYLYSTHLDFSPRNLADILRKFFEKEILEKKKEPTIVIDEKTRSVILQASKREDIMVHAAEEEASFHPSFAPSDSASGVARAKPKKKSRSFLISLGILLALTVAGYFGIKTLAPDLISGFTGKTAKEESLQRPTGKALPPPTIPPEEEETGAEKPEEPKPVPVPATGTIEIITNPAGATISLDGSITNLKTPAAIASLNLGKVYQIRVELENYQPMEKSVTLVTPEPLRLEGDLEPSPIGVIEVQSTPAGADIFLNGRITGKATPSKLEGLAVGRSYTVRLTKDGHETWTRSVDVKGFDPVKLTASLAPIIKPEVPKPVEAAPQYGSVRINSTPSGAAIFLNGRSTGQSTPATLEGLGVGKNYTVKLAREGYQSWSKKIYIKSGQTTSLSASLSQLKPRAPEPVYEEQAEEPKRYKEPEDAPVRIGGYGSIKIDSKPSGAEVYINAEYKGTTPLTASNVPAGTAKVLLSKEGFMRYSSRINLNSSQTKDLGTIRLQDMYGEVSVHSNPPRASVYFDGQRIGAKTPVTIKKVPRDRNHSLRVETEGYRPWSTTVDLESEGTKKYNVVLEKE